MRGFALVLGILLGISGCAKNDSSSSSMVVPKGTPVGCDQNPEVGAKALMSNANQTEIVRSSFFGKPFDRYDLEAVLDASSVSTTDYVRSLGLTVQKISGEKSAAGECKTYAHLEEANEDNRKLWAEASGSVGGGGGVLQGLFFENCGEPGTPGCDDRRMINPTILLNEKSDRWTIVHEMMHFGFNQGRKLSPDVRGRQELLREGGMRQKNMIKVLEAYTEAPNQGDLIEGAKELRALTQIGYELMVASQFEEIAIEGMLIDLWFNDQLKNLSSKIPSEWYMESSRQAALQRLAQTKSEQLIADLKKEAQAHFWPLAEAELDAAQAILDQAKKESLVVIAEAKNKIAQKTRAAPKGLVLQSLTAPSPSLDEVRDFEQHLAAHDLDGAQERFTTSMQKLNQRITRILIQK